ncbi:hypothetical protein BCR39DRAFT_508291, partial [Naematelia encephala]
ALESPYPLEVQKRFYYGPRGNKNQLQTGSGRPRYCIIKKSSLLTGDMMERIMRAMEHALTVGCRPFLKSNSRSSGHPSFHVGHFLKPSSQHDTPWVSRDTLQPSWNDSASATATHENRQDAMMSLALAIDSVLNGRVQKALKEIDPSSLKWSQRRVREEGKKGAINYSTSSIPPNAARSIKEDDISQLFRYGNLATCVAIGRGQSEKLHLDLHDDNKSYTIILNCGHPSDPWDRSENQGSLVLPTLGGSLPMNLGDVVFLEASTIPHRRKDWW